MGSDSKGTIVVLVVVALGGWVVYNMVNEPSATRGNYNVNENNFLRVWKAGNQDDIATILGNPDTTGEGEVVQVPTVVSADACFTIATRCEKSPPDHFAYFRGTQNEQIRLLYAGASKQLVAAEYLVDGSPVYYLGPTIGCRTVEFRATGRGNDDAEMIAQEQAERILPQPPGERAHPLNGQRRLCSGRQAPI